MVRFSKKGQSALEYTILLIIVMAALLTMQIYLKRGMQGRMKGVVDDLGDQYDPRTAVGTIVHSMSGNTITRVISVPEGNGLHTTRVDLSNTIDTRAGSMTVGTYTN